MSKMKYIIIVPDGMADEPLEELGGKTPLESARTTNMDYLAQHGKVGLVQTIPAGMSAGSDVANMAILGYDPKTCHSGRAPLEAANLNIMLAPDQIAVRCNLVTIHDETMADYSSGHISTKEASVLIDALNLNFGNEQFKFYSGKGYRHLLVMKADDPQAAADLKTVPPHDILGKKITPYLPKGSVLAEMLLNLMEQAGVILSDHSINKVRIDLKENPANSIWLWGHGTKPNLISFQEKFDLKGAIISAVDLVNGIGRLIGLDVIDVPGATGYYDTNYAGKAVYALKALKNHDLVYIHIEAPDEAGHNGDIRAKIEAIERVDRDILGPILNRYNEHDDVRILVMPDHPTPIKLRTHTADPVGYVMFGRGLTPDGTETFNEKAAQEKGVKFTSGHELMEYFLKKHLE